MFATYRPILSLLRGTAFMLAASGLARPADAAARPGGRVFHRGAGPARHRLGGRIRGRLFPGPPSGAAGRSCAGIRNLRGHQRNRALLTGLMISEWSWLVLRAFTGFTTAGSFMVIESWLNERATNETAARFSAST